MGRKLDLDRGQIVIELRDRLGADNTLLTSFWCNSQASAMRATETPRALAIG